MHKNFGEWYRLVSIEPNGELLRKRWAGVEEWVSALRGDDDSILETVRIFQGLPPKDSHEAFLEVFRKHDPAFPQRNELELRVLAGASLVKCVPPSGDKDDDVRAAIVAGSAVGASSLRGSTESRLNEVTEEILAGLQAIARNQRKRAVFKPSFLRTEAEAEAAALEAVKQVSGASSWTELKQVLQSLLDAVRRSERALSVAAHNLRCADEETEILWWLEGGCSRDLNKPWSSLPKEAVPLIAAKELADLTDVALGLQDAAALLHRIVTNAECKETSIEAYVNAVPNEWAKALAARVAESALDLAPLSLALSHRGKSDTSSWQQFFDATSGMRSTAALAPNCVAWQVYVEAVLLRTLAHEED